MRAGDAHGNMTKLNKAKPVLLGTENHDRKPVEAVMVTGKLQDIPSPAPDLPAMPVI